jgi:hypothetical protein
MPFFFTKKTPAATVADCRGFGVAAFTGPLINEVGVKLAERIARRRVSR